jgi:hypothetical protein
LFRNLLRRIAKSPFRTQAPLSFSRHCRPTS